MTNQSYCDHCGEIIENEENAIYSNCSSHTHWFCSEACARAEGFGQCEECWEWVPTHELGYIPGLGDWCLACLEDKCVCCEKCGE